MLTRKEVPENLKWDTKVIFADLGEWNKLYDECESEMNFSVYEGKLSDDETLLECMKKLDEAAKKIQKLGVYAMMRHDENTALGEANALVSRVDALEIKLASQTAFFSPELASLEENKLLSLAADPRFSDYDYMLRRVIEEKRHVLGKEAENVLALGGQVFQGFKSIFTKIDNADFPFPEIEANGEKIRVTHGMYGVLMQSDDRETRRKAFQSYYAAYKTLLNTISATYIGNVNKDVFLSRARKYGSCLEAALFGEDVPREVYDNLLSSVHDALDVLHEYVANKKKVLGLDEMHMFDMYAPLVENAELKLDYEEAFKLVKKGLEPLGKEYGELLQRAHDEGWIDVCETENKRSGAYSVHVYALTHPYVLLNYQKTTNDVFTIAHELGHAMHSHFSSKNQPFAKADYTIFVAEIASTVNEVLLLKYLVKNTDDKKLKKYLLAYYMDMIKSTLFRQTMFAEFEYAAHNEVESGNPLTKERLNEIYLDLNKKYYGDAVVSDEEISFEWARIPHFYNAFYVYKYATGIISAISIAERIYSEGLPAVNDYFRFLSSGGSDGPVKLLRLAGVDLTDKRAFSAAMEAFAGALEEFKKL